MVVVIELIIYSDDLSLNPLKTVKFVEKQQK